MLRMWFALVFLSSCSWPTSWVKQGNAVKSCSEQVSRHAGLDADKTVQRVLYSPMLIGGKPANPGDWPASVYMHFGSSSCSSTLVGPKVLLTAGHCVDDGGKINFTAGANRYTARCSNHPEYADNETADISACAVDRPVIGVEFENVATKMQFKIGDKIRLTGYGCVKSPGVGGNDGIYRIGEAEVSELPYGKNYWIYTLGGAALCFGDSGGPSFKEFSDGSRELTGISSQGDIKTDSYLTAVSSPAIQAFLKDFAKKNGVKICGIHSGTPACRAATKTPEPDLTFEYKNGLGCIKGNVTVGNESKKAGLFEDLKKTMNSWERK